jgi:hypothetical protein
MDLQKNYHWLIISIRDTVANLLTGLLPIFHTPLHLTALLLPPEIIYSEISQDLSSLYLGLDDFCLFKPTAWAFFGAAYRTTCKPSASAYTEFYLSPLRLLSRPCCCYYEVYRTLRTDPARGVNVYGTPLNCLLRLYSAFWCFFL